MTYIAVIMKILDRLDSGLPPIVYGDGSQSYDFIYVGDCARANIQAMKPEATDAFYNVGMGVKTSIRGELAELILEVTGSDQQIEYRPGGLTFVQNRVGSTEKAEQEIGFKAQVQLREGLQQLIAWRDSHKSEVEKRRKKLKAQRIRQRRSSKNDKTLALHKLEQIHEWRPHYVRS